jgi:hypothetical protein
MAAVAAVGGGGEQVIGFSRIGLQIEQLALPIMVIVISSPAQQRGRVS